MPGAQTSTGEVRTALASAYGAAVSSPAVGTEHLLCGLAAPMAQSGAAAPVLAIAELTFPVVMAVLRRRRSEGWRSDDGASDDLPPPHDQDWFQVTRKAARYTGAARLALHRAAVIAAEEGLAEVGGGHLLEGLLAYEGNRAVELVRACGQEPAALLDRLRGAGPVAEVTDPVAPELRPTRDALLGKASYRTDRFSGRVWSAIVRVFPVAEVPTGWAFQEAPEQARRLRMRETGTEHLLLGILAVTETLCGYPHLRPADAGYRYRGGEVLAEAGVTYRGAREAIRAHPERLGRDARRWSSYRQPAWYKPSFAGTGELLLAVLTQDDSRAANLLRQLGIAPAAVREQLRARPSAR